MSEKSLRFLSLLAIAAALLFTITASASAPFNGQWYVEPSSKSGEIQVTLRYERHWDGGNSNSMQSFDTTVDKAVGLTAEVMNSAGTHAQFNLVREAGTFVCDGWFAGGKGSGNYDFQADQKFAAELEKRGVGTPTAEQQFRLAMADTTIEFVDSLKAAKYEFDVEDLVRTVNHGVTAKYVREINGLGYKPATLGGLIRLRDHGVTPEFVKAIQSSGLKDLPEEQMVRLRDHGVTPDYIQQLSQFGIKDLPAEGLIRLRDHGVSPEFIASIRQAGYNATPEELTRLRDHGVSAEFVKEVKGAGLQATAQDLSTLRDHGVSGDFIAEVLKAGFANLSVHDLTRLRDHGVDAGYLKLHGKGRSIDQVIHMHDTGGENDVL